MTPTSAATSSIVPIFSVFTGELSLEFFSLGYLPPYDIKAAKDDDLRFYFGFGSGISISP